MRSLPNIIKASEYVIMKNGSAFPANSKAPNAEDNPLSTPEQQACDLREEQRNIVDSAKLEAQQLIEAAQTYSLNKMREITQQINEESAQVRARSHEDGYAKGLSEGRKAGEEQGYQQGYEEGVKKAQEENREVLEELTAMLSAVEEMKADVLQKFQDELKKLAVAIAEKVIKKELSLDAQVMQEIIKKAMDDYVNQSWIKIIVSKDTKSQLVDADHSIIDALRDISENVRIEASPDMKDGDCIIDLPDSMIDAGVETQMTKIKQALEI